MFFDSKRYDLAKVGRFKFNKKLSVAARITGYRAAEKIVDSLTKKTIVEADQIISREDAEKIQNCGINEVFIITSEGKSKSHRKQNG